MIVRRCISRVPIVVGTYSSNISTTITVVNHHKCSIWKEEDGHHHHRRYLSSSSLEEQRKLDHAFCVDLVQKRDKEGYCTLLTFFFFQKIEIDFVSHSVLFLMIYICVYIYIYG